MGRRRIVTVGCALVFVMALMSFPAPVAGQRAKPCERSDSNQLRGLSSTGGKKPIRDSISRP